MGAQLMAWWEQLWAALGTSPQAISGPFSEAFPWAPALVAVVAALLLVVIARSRLGRFLAGLVLLVVIAGALMALPGPGRPSGDAEHRLAALTERAVAARPALACLEGLAGDAVDGACERALFAQPDTVALALWYTRERLALLAEAGPARNGAMDGLRRALEADRYGFVAQALAARQNCTPTDCEALKLFREPATILANLKSSAYGALVARYAASWGDLPLAANAALPGTVGAVPSAAGAIPPGALPPVAPRAGITLPGASAIPPVSIMTEPEPRAPAAAVPPAAPAQSAPPPAPKKKAAAKRPVAPPQPLAPPPAAPEPDAQPQ